MVAKENFKHINSDEFLDKELTLHDCVANHVSYVDGILRFDFPDGFWVTPHHEGNSSEKTVRTDATFYWNNLCLNREW